MVLGAVIIGGYFFVELFVGIIAQSLALIADAGHMLTDVIALNMGLVALLLARRGSKRAERTFGWHRAEVLTALINAALLLFVAGFVLYEAIERLGTNPQIDGPLVIVVALIGLLVNVIVIMLLRADSKESIAVRGAYMEVLADAVGSVGVLVAGVVTMVTGWGYADIIVAVMIALWVLPRAIRLALDGLRILVQNSPKHIDVEAVRTDLEKLGEVHDLHVWTLTTGMDVATVHLATDDDSDEVLSKARESLAEHGLHHATIQVEAVSVAQQCKHELTW